MYICVYIYTVYIYIKLHVIRRHLLLQHLPAQTHLHPKKRKNNVSAQTGTTTTTRLVIGVRAVKSAVPVWIGRQKQKKKTCHWLLGHRTSVFDVTVTSSTTTAPRHLVDRKLMSMPEEEEGRRQVSNWSWVALALFTTMPLSLLSRQKAPNPLSCRQLKC